MLLLLLLLSLITFYPLDQIVVLDEFHALLVARARVGCAGFVRRKLGESIETAGEKESVASCESRFLR